MVTNNTSNKYEDLIYYSVDAQNKLKSGINKIVDAVKVTLGPYGRNVIFAGEDGSPIITKDGVSVSNYIKLIDPIENMAADILKQVSRKTVDEVGDGTTTSMVLAQALINNTPEDVININSYKKHLEQYKDIILNYLEENKTKITLDDKNVITKILLTSANQDEEISKNLLKALQFTGLDGLISIAKTKNNESKIEYESGYRLNRGWLSSYFINNPNNATTNLKDCYLLLLRDRLESFKSIIPVLKTAHSELKPLIIIAKDFSDDVVATCAKNFSMNTLVVPLQAEGYNDDVIKNLEDLALYCDGTVITAAELKDGVGKVGIIDNITINRDFATIKSSVNESAIASRVAQLKHLLKESENEFEKKKIKERISKLTTGVAIIKVGGYTEAEIKEKFDRYEDALGAMKAAITHGVLPGGGTALYKSAQNLMSLTPSVNEEAVQALDCLIKSLMAPYQTILKNADIPNHKLKLSAFNIGYDLSNCVERDMIKCGIVDPFLVTVSALKSAISIATMIITTGCVAKNTETILL